MLKPFCACCLLEGSEALSFFGNYSNELCSAGLNLLGLDLKGGELLNTKAEKTSYCCRTVFRLHFSLHR